MFGMHGSKFSNYAVQNSDLLIALGARFDDRVTGKLSTFAPEAKVVHLDVDPAEISKLVTATVPLVGDLKRLLPQLTEEVRRLFAAQGRADLGPWLKRVEAWREKHPLKYEQAGQKYLLPQYVIEAIWKKTGGKAVVTTGVGEHQMFAAQWWKTSGPRQFITSGGLGTMGFCLPAAIGIQLGRPGELVIGIDGDGSFQMTLQDLATAARPEPAHQDLHPQQPLPRHGPAVAGALLREPLRPDPALRLPGLREAGRRLRLPRAAGPDAGGARPGHRPGPRQHRTGPPSSTCASAARRRSSPWSRPARPSTT